MSLAWPALPDPGPAGGADAASAAAVVAVLGQEPAGHAGIEGEGHGKDADEGFGHAAERYGSVTLCC